MKIFIEEECKKEEGFPCLKQSVFAMIETENGTKVFGTNNINNKVTICPREEAGYKTGEGYHLCQEVCNQNSHAEVTAINKAKSLGLNLKNAKLTLTGHTYCCDNCKNEMQKAGIVSVNILN